MKISPPLPGADAQALCRIFSTLELEALKNRGFSTTRPRDIDALNMASQ